MAMGKPEANDTTTLRSIFLLQLRDRSCSSIIEWWGIGGE